MARRMLGLGVCCGTALGQGAGGSAPDFEKHVWPILEGRCVSCHRATHTDASGKVQRPKGRVQLDDAAAMRRAKRARLIVPGDPDGSLLIEVVELPADDEDRMPPAKDGPLLDRKQISTLREWIAGGADFGGWTSAGKTASKATKAEAKTARDRPAPTVDGAESRLADGLAPCSQQALAAARGLGFSVSPIRAGSPLLRLSCYGSESAIDDATLRQLEPLTPNLCEVSLAGSRVGDAALLWLATWPRLCQLDLRNTDTGDLGVQALAKAPALVSLNLFGTKVGDRGLAYVSRSSTLREVYVWQSDVTTQGTEATREANPNLRVQAGPQLPPKAETPTSPARRRR